MSPAPAAESTTTDGAGGTSISTAPKEASQTGGTGHGGAGNSSSTSAEFEPPLACIRRILKQALPKSTNVGKDASMAFSRACGIFCIYLTTCANDFARENKRSTITAADVLAAMKELDFDEFVPQLETFLEDHRADEKRKKEAKSQIMDAIHTEHSEKKAGKGKFGSAAEKAIEPDPKKPKSAPAEDDEAAEPTENDNEEEEEEDGDDDDDNNEEEENDDGSMDEDKDDGDAEGEGVADEGDENEERGETQSKDDMQE